MRPSLSNLLNKSVFIQSHTYIGNDGRAQSYCGLKLADIPVPGADGGEGPSSASRYAHTRGRRKSAGPMHHRSSKKTLKRAALTSAGIPVVYHNLGPPSHTCSGCAAVMWYEERNDKAKRAVNPTFSLCCQEGKVLLPKFKDTPPPLKQLLDYQDTTTAKFRDQIRVYNSMFCFTSFGAKIDHSVNTGRGPYTFRISGQNYHQMGSLLPAEGVRPRYAQLYFFDTGNEIKNRMSAFVDKESREMLDETIVSGLTQMLDQGNPIVKSFRMAKEWCHSNPSSDFTLKLLSERKTTRQYNAPTVSEVAALIINDFGDVNPSRDIVVNKTNTGLQRISELHSSYMALQYPLLFPFGEDGFNEHIPYHRNTGTHKTKRENVTMKEYYAYIIQQRNNQGNTLLKGGRLFQQYLVDAFTAVEEQRLKWTRNNQDTLRVDLYHNLCDAVTRGDTNAEGLGKRIVLPRSFIGSPRYMMQNYQDAMALCRAYGNPDLFITFTSNPKWPEITKMLAHFPGQRSHDRPEIGCRVFKMKLTELLDDLTKNKIFGDTCAIVYVIEFQKRGLPHAHILLWLEEKYKCRKADKIDDIISAELPSPVDDPEGYKVVSEFMLHGPCGQDAAYAPCTTDGKCSKHFPKKFLAETVIDEDGYALYRRRNNKVTAKKGKFVYDNKHVVPYNRYLLLKYHAHINVEWCNRSKAIKYLFKYLNKGPDRATIVIQENVREDRNGGPEQIVEVDEIKNYQNCRFISPCEAVWRLFSYDLHYSYPPVMQLNYHLPNQNAITMRDSENLPALLEREGIDITMFTEWFELNKEYPPAREYTYAQIPEHYVWHAREKKWKPRKQKKYIGRIVYSSPASGERYFLRMLLNVVRGDTSFAKLMTVNDKEYATFKAACFAYGLLKDDKEWTHAITEARNWTFGPQLRDLFVTILLFCEVSRPLQLWEENWEALSEDILYTRRKLYSYPQLQLTEEQLKNYCLLEIQELLNRHGKSLNEFHDLPKPDPRLMTNLDNRLIREALAFDMNKSKVEHQQLHSMLNPEQRLIYEQVIQSVYNQQGQFCFIHVPGGTGKTFLYKTIIARIRSAGMIVLAVASSGIASLLLPGGRTAHSRFVIPLELMENGTCVLGSTT